MHAMQYEITLPADYDMGIVRHRVATRGAGTDALGGLGVKAYLIRERGIAGSPVNQYAPLYLWADPAGMDDFLLGPGFGTLSADFGRPSVRRWSGLGVVAGPAIADRPVAASRRTVRVDADGAPTDAAQEAHERATALGATDGVHLTAVGLDPRDWELVHFTLWTQPPPAGDGERYEVLHVSAPYRADLLRRAG